jgi:hypothetical protein
MTKLKKLKNLMPVLVLLGKANFWPLIVVLATLLFYYLAQANVAWYVYMVASVIVVERGLLQLRILIGKYVMDLTIKRLSSTLGNLRESAPSAYTPPLIPPTTETGADGNAS